MPRPDFPRTVLEFQQRFSTEEACQDYLYDCRWPEGFVCPRCGGEDGVPISTRSTLIRCENCNYQASLTAGTVLHRTHTALVKWFWAAYLVATHTPGFSALQFQRYVGVSYETAFNMLHKLRAAMVRPDRDKIHGVVEVDESYVGGYRPGVGGRGAAGKAIVVGAIEVLPAAERQERAGRLRMRIVSDASAVSLVGFITATVERGSAVWTDDWQGYAPLRRTGYEHNLASPNELEHIHHTFGNLKTWIKGTHHGVSRKHLQAYLNEFVFRHNRRHTPMAAFQTVLGLAMQVHGPTYRELYAAGHEAGWVHPNPWT